MRKGQFSLKHYCISETGSVQSKTYAKTGRFAIRILFPHFSLGIAEIRRIQPTQIVRASSCSLQKSCRLCSDKKRRWFYKQRINDLQQRVHYDNTAGKAGVHYLQNDVSRTVYPCRPPKIGKSWLALDLCMSVANGEQFLKHDTNTGQVLYLSLEDNLLRLQNRIYDLTDEPCENLNFAIEAQSIGNGLEEELEKSKQELPNLKVIVIDTLQKIRCNTDVNYGSDYKELSVLKALADKLKVAILVVHHTRKCYDSDPFNMVSGSTGIIGSVDGIMVMIEQHRGSGKAKLHCAGRDIEHLELNLEFANHRWNVVDDVPESKPDLFSFAIHDLMVDEKRFTGSATELCNLMYKRFGREYAPNWMTRNLVQHTDELKVYGVLFSMRRSHGSRILELVYDQSGDSKNGSLLWVEITDHTGTRSPENVYLPLFEAGDGKNMGDGICGSG